MESNVLSLCGSEVTIKIKIKQLEVEGARAQVAGDANVDCTIHVYYYYC